MGKSWKWTSRWAIESLGFAASYIQHGQRWKPQKKQSSFRDGTRHLSQKKITCILSFSNGGQHCNTTNVEEVVEIIIDIDKVEPMSKVVQNYFQLNIHVLQFGYSFNPTISTIEFKYTIK